LVDCSIVPVNGYGVFTFVTFYPVERLPSTMNAAPTLVTLLGKKDLDTALICLTSLTKHAKEPFKILILDDSSLDTEDAKKLTDSLPLAEICLSPERNEMIESKLKYFPSCLKFRQRNVLAQKLFDCALIHEEPYINFIDSDIFFLRDFYGFPLADCEDKSAVFMSDIQTAYALHPKELLKNPKLSLPKAINSGLISFPRIFYNLNFLESFLEKQIDQPTFRSCWAEQTCWAFLAGKINCRVWDSKQLQIASPYKINEFTNAVAVHFVSSYRSLLHDFKDKIIEHSGETSILQTYPCEKLSFLHFGSQRLLAKITG